MDCNPAMDTEVKSACRRLQATSEEWWWKPAWGWWGDREQWWVRLISLSFFVSLLFCNFLIQEHQFVGLHSFVHILLLYKCTFRSCTGCNWSSFNFVIVNWFQRKMIWLRKKLYLMGVISCTIEWKPLSHTFVCSAIEELKYHFPSYIINSLKSLGLQFSWKNTFFFEYLHVKWNTSTVKATSTKARSSFLPTCYARWQLLLKKIWLGICPLIQQICEW